MKHAEIQIGEYKVPLIGIPMSAVEYKCDSCKETFHIQELELNYGGNKFLCIKCKIDDTKTKKYQI